MMSTPIQKQNRESLLKVRVRPDTKRRVIDAARILDLDQSTLVRLAVQDYLARNCPHAA
jgi:predicted transcriptional regulator